jgi:hypothetical protein
VLPLLNDSPSLHSRRRAVSDINVKAYVDQLRQALPYGPPLALGEIKGDIYTAVVDSLKVLDSERPIREAVLDRNDFDPTA